MSALNNQVTSIRARLLWALLILLPILLGSLAITLEKAYTKGSLQAEKEKLSLNVLNILTQLEVVDTAVVETAAVETAVVETGAGNTGAVTRSSVVNSEPSNFRILMPDTLLDANFNRPSSGFYAFVISENGTTRWASPSTDTEPNLQPAKLLDKKTAPQAGDYQFLPEVSDQYFLMRHVSFWQTRQGEVPVHLVIAKSKQWYKIALNQYRNTLLISLLLISLTLIALLYSIVRWGLRPLDNLSTQVKALEAGEQEELTGHHPKELTPLVDNLKQLITKEREQRERYRNTLADLAHSLKTPLAIMNGLGIDDATTRQQLSEQVDNMNKIVEYQLQRAVSASAHRLMNAVKVKPVCQRIQSVLSKVYADRKIDCNIEIGEGTEFQGDERDLMELLGNVMENAHKYTRHLVEITAKASQRKNEIDIIIEDDGGGIPEHKRVSILQRGQRADTIQSGQGIGLAVAVDIIESYEAQIAIQDSALGGAKFILTLPGRYSD